MEFHLTYEGPLTSGRYDGTVRALDATAKHEIRKAFHPQLKRLWEISPVLNESSGHSHFVTTRGPNSKPYQPHNVAALSDRFALGNYSFVPLVTENLAVSCTLDVLVLRLDHGGQVVSAGDIDNRFKTLFDGLRMPHNEAEFGKYKDPDDGEKPLFCLLQDDSLITKVRLEADALLQPVSGNRHDARVIIRVSLKPAILTPFNIGFG